MILPTLGLIDQVTPVLLEPVTEALNCWLCPTVSVAVGGLTEIVTNWLTWRVTVNGTCGA